MMKKPIPAKISERRKALGLTQEKLGTMLGVSPQAVSKWENAECLPDLTLIPELCAALRITADDLLEVAPQPAGRNGTALVSAADVRIVSGTGMALTISGADAVRAIQHADLAGIRDIASILTDEDGLRILQALSFTAIGSEDEIAARCGLSPENARSALFRLLRMELCQCDPNGYVLGTNAYLAYAALSAAWLASPAGRAYVGEITVSYTTHT